MLIIVDVDGTVSDWEIRAKAAGKMPSRKNRKSFQKWLDSVQSDKSLAKDRGIPEVIQIVNDLHAANHDIVFLTGRSENYRAVTEEWLIRNTEVWPMTVIMRNTNDWRSAAQYKEAQLKKLLKGYKGLVAACDDDFDGDTTHVYAKLGIRHLKIMPGENK